MNSPTVSSTAKLIWKEEYSVHVKEIDEQHKGMFEIINSLIDVVDSTSDEQSITEIIQKIVTYKACHFCTEENYFEKFNFDGAKEHIEAHKCFNIEIMKIQNMYAEDSIKLAFALVDYLENWLVQHLLSMDKKYSKCFNEHGLS